MCGIVGYVGPLQDKDLEALGKALTYLRHRGPDATASETREGVAFGHTRLAIIDLSGGAQPMETADGRYLITFNGEIYNFVELKQELVAAGLKFRTESDTEVLLNGFAHWQEKVVDKLNGMFAFAIYDGRTKRVFCARDPFGQKPFYYVAGGGKFLFASETSAFAPFLGERPPLDRSSLAHYLSFDGFYGERSLFEGVKKLAPGHWLTYDKGQMETRRYFFSTPGKGDSREVDEDSIDAELERSVRMASRADVPVGVLLSGGLDSSLVLAYFRKSYPAGKAEAFHMRSTSPTFDEEKYARRVAEHLGVQLSVFDLPPEKLTELARKVPALVDEPQADPGILPKYEVSAQIRRRFKVALTGDGGDEIFYGYALMKAQALARFYRRLPDGVQRLVRRGVDRLPSRFGYMSFDFMAKNFVKGFPSVAPLRAHHWMRSFDRNEIGRLLAGGFVDEGIADGVAHLRALAGGFDSPDSLACLAYQLQNTFLPDYVLCNSDRASMLHSLELRSPLLDTRLAERVNAIPDEIKMSGLKTKALMKRVAERHLPKDAVYRRKIGFTVPVAEILRTTLREELQEIFAPSLLKRQGIFVPEETQRLLTTLFEGRQQVHKKVWMLYSLQKWLLARGY